MESQSFYIMFILPFGLLWTPYILSGNISEGREPPRKVITLITRETPHIIAPSHIIENDHFASRKNN